VFRQQVFVADSSLGAQNEDGHAAWKQLGCGLIRLKIGASIAKLQIYNI
jgi:hypothetical protein